MLNRNHLPFYLPVILHQHFLCIFLETIYPSTDECMYTYRRLFSVFALLNNYLAQLISLSLIQFFQLEFPDAHTPVVLLFTSLAIPS